MVQEENLVLLKVKLPAFQASGVIFEGIVQLQFLLENRHQYYSFQVKMRACTAVKLQFLHITTKYCS